MMNINGYKGIVSESYDIWFAGDTFDDTAFFRKLIEEVPGAALEIGCGTGRLLLPYLKAGLEIEGVDCSQEMMDICKQKAEALGVSPVLYDQFMQDLDLPRKYKTIFIPLASFMLVTNREDAITALSKFYQHLEEEGQVIIPLFIPKEQFNANKKEWAVRRVGTRYDGDEIVLSAASTINFNEQLQTNWNKYEIYKESSLVESKFTTSELRWYYKYEFKMMLEKAGFKDISIYGGYNFEKLNDDQAFMIFRARK
jgi:ubiquinone/menaquinone biosynthesis C-methylase UbiE